MRRREFIAGSGGAATPFAFVLSDAMGWFDRLFGRTPGPTTQLLARFRRKSRSPTDLDLLKIAKDGKGHVSRKAARDEYNRLVLEKYANDKA
jgi:hypothetical protein